MPSGDKVRGSVGEGRAVYVRCLNLGKVSDRISCCVQAGTSWWGGEAWWCRAGAFAPGGEAGGLGFIFVRLERTLGTPLAAAFWYWRACGCHLTNPSWLKGTVKGQEAAVPNWNGARCFWIEWAEGEWVPHGATQALEPTLGKVCQPLSLQTFKIQVTIALRKLVWIQCWVCSE